MAEYRTVVMRDRTGPGNFKVCIERKWLWWWRPVRDVDPTSTQHGQVPMSMVKWFSRLDEAEDWLFAQYPDAKVTTVHMTYIF